MKYKVGDKVRINSLDWYNENKGNDGIVEFSTSVFVPGMSQFCGKIVTIENVFEEEDDVVYCMEGIDYDWTNEMIEGLAVEKTNPKFKVGDKIISDVFTTKDDKGWRVIDVERTGYKLISINNSDLICDMDFKNEHYYKLVEEETKSEPKFKAGDKVILDSHPCEITNVQWKNGYGFVYAVRGADFGYTVKETDLIFDERTVPNTNEIIQLIKNDWNNFKDRYDIPDDYHFVDKNGNEINISEIVLEKKKKEYPKTYEKCVEILGRNADVTYGYKKYVLHTLQMLLVCRDAYWQIAGAEMGLDEPWEPDWEDYEQKKFIFVVEGNTLIKKEYSIQSCILAFPTEEIRDAFYEAFKELIEECKELL